MMENTTKSFYFITCKARSQLIEFVNTIIDSQKISQTRCLFDILLILFPLFKLELIYTLHILST
jgi:hypothetical protein